MNQTGQKIYELRKENKLTQKELATMLGKTPKMISFYERGERAPSRDVLFNLSTIFDVSIDYLLNKTNDPRTAVALVREKFGFYYTYMERENIKAAFPDCMRTAYDLAEKIKLCELDMKQYFSRSVDSSGFDLSHVPFPQYAAMLLNQKYFKEKYEKAYPALAAKYPPEPGIPEGRTYVLPGESERSDDAIRGLTRMIADLPSTDRKLLEQLVTNMLQRSREDD